MLVADNVGLTWDDLRSELFFEIGGRSANVMLRLDSDFFFVGEGKVCIEVERSKLAALGRVADFDEESVDVPEISFVLDWINNTENSVLIIEY